MDKKSITGLVLIGAILIGWMLMSQPTAEEIAKRKEQHITDSIAQFKTNDKIKEGTTEVATKPTVIPGSPLSMLRDSTGKINDSVRSIIQKQVYGGFSEASNGDNKIIVIENEVIKVSVSPKGGRICSVELKKYKTFNQKPLILFDADSSKQNIVFSAYSKEFATDSLFFTPSAGSFNLTGAESKSITMRLYAGDKSKYIEYVYSFTGNEYMVGFKINTVGMQDIITNKANITMNWGMKTPMLEQSQNNQHMASTIYYLPVDENRDYISNSKDEKLVLEKKTKWIGLKQQFFTSSIIADNSFEAASEIETKTPHGSIDYVREYNVSLIIPFNHSSADSYGMRMYFGPNHYKTLKKYDVGLEEQIDLGWKIFGWINRFLTIPIFNFLNSFNLNYGIIILILTIILKLLLLPIAYKTILSSAKMRVLKPEIDELNEKHKNDDPVKKQQATMALYKSVGVNPMAGCIPVLLQMPILIALFRFFPASIELRQQGFLWAHDLSTFDSIYNFGFNVPWYGDHVSLFALLMTASTLLYTWSNSQIMGTSNQMPGMKWMMYLMPIMFLGFMNSYSAGLSWYYFLANMFTFGQTWIIQKFVIDNDALHAKLQENKKKPVKQSKFQERLEQMTKDRQQQVSQKKK